MAVNKDVTATCWQSDRRETGQKSILLPSVISVLCPVATSGLPAQLKLSGVIKSRTPPPHTHTPPPPNPEGTQCSLHGPAGPGCRTPGCRPPSGSWSRKRLQAPACTRPCPAPRSGLGFLLLLPLLLRLLRHLLRGPDGQEQKNVISLNTPPSVMNREVQCYDPSDIG